MGQEYIRTMEIIPATGISPAVLLHDNFDRVRKITLTGSGYDYVRREPGEDYSGQFLFVMATKDTDAANWIAQTWNFGVSKARFIELIFLIQVPSGGGKPRVRFKFYMNERGYLREYAISYDYNTGNWVYITTSGVWPGGILLNRQMKIGRWHRISIVIDRKEKTYYSLSNGFDREDMTDKACYESNGESNVEYSYLTIQLLNNIAEVSKLYISEILIKPLS